MRSFAKLAKLIIALKKDKEGLQDVIAGLEVQNNELMLDRDKLISDTIKSPMLARKNSEEVIKTKSKAKGKKGPEMILKCEYPDCDNSNEDALIKCNSCSKWICESCSDIAIPKYKTISNKCQNVYFACNNCAKSSVDQGFILDSDSSPAVVTSTATASIASAAEGNTVTEKGDLVSTLTDLFDKKVLQIETKLEKLIESKLADTKSKNNSATKSDDTESYAAKVLEVPKEIRKVIEEAKNDEKVEENEIARRAKNFVIHGAEEFGRNEDKVKENDKQYVSDVFKKLGVAAKPVSIIRLGRPNESEKRPLKIVMRTDDEKKKVMSSLGRLKGTAEEFGKISITDDHTAAEREQIKKFSMMAKEKSSKSTDKVFKVRGDPKNGLRLVSFAKS